MAVLCGHLRNFCCSEKLANDGTFVASFSEREKWRKVSTPSGCPHLFVIHTDI